MRINKYKLPNTRALRVFPALVFLCTLCGFAGNNFAQTNLDFLAETIKRGSAEQKRDALFQIRNLESAEASRVAVPALADKSEIVRATAAFSVVFLPKDETLFLLTPLLTDKKELVRREAAYALGKVGDSGALTFLLRLVQKDKVREVRAAAVIALGAIGDASAVPALTAILQRKPNDKEEFLRRSAARSIGQIAQIVQTGEREIQTPESILPAENVLITEPKYKNLIETFPIFRTANEILIQILQNLRRESADVKREATFALGAIGDTSAVPVLQTNVDAEDYYLAEISREALRKIRLSNKSTNDIKTVLRRR